MTAIEMTIDPRVKPVGNSTVRRLLPWRKRRMVGPFIFLDLMGPAVIGTDNGVDIDAHPHIGLSTLTYLFDGRLKHRDSTGAVQTIEPGAVNWMTAGSGVSHTERSTDPDRLVATPLHGVQTWVALPHDAEDGPASFEHADAESVPEIDFGASRVRVVAGSGWGHDSPIRGSSELVLAELRIAEEAGVSVDGIHPERAVLAIDGTVRIDGALLPEGHLAVLEEATTPTLTGPGRAMVLGGAPIGPRHIWWNFVHSDLERIEHAKVEWMAQNFPLVPGDSDPWVALP